MWWKKSNKRIYLDYAAATPVRKEVLKAMKPFWAESFGNAGAVHKEGVAAKKAVEEARAEVARTLRVRAEHVTFTSGGTESNNLILFGAIEAAKLSGVPYSEMEIISTKLEHPSVKKVLEKLERKGVLVRYVPVGEDGKVVFAEFQKLLSPRTRLVTFAYANSETGVVENIGRLGREIKRFEKEKGIKIVFHTDASQAPLWLPLALDALFVDAMTLDAGKCYGPKGVGVLVHLDKVRIEPLMFGGGQEEGLRPGTENTALIIGAAKALFMAQDKYKERAAKTKELRDRFLERLLKIQGVVVNGSRDERLSNNVNISVPGIDSEYAVVTLDAGGIAASTKSACGGASGAGSHVVKEMTGDAARAASTIRFTLGEATTWPELKKAAMLLEAHIAKMRAFKGGK